MNIDREQVIKWAREAGFEVNFDIRAVSVDGVHINKELERFAALAYAAGAAAERNRTWTQEHWTEYERSIAAAEREACAKVCDTADKSTHPADLADAIRARSKR